MLTKIYQTIKEYDNIVIYRHARPDCDAVGSQLALKESLQLTYPKKNIYAVGDMSDRCQWIGKMDEVSDDICKNSLAVVLDSGASFLISDDRWKTAKYVIKIDHHTAQDDYGNLTYVDTNSESCSSIIAEYIFNKHYKINNHIAELLYLGIVTDSGRFRYSQTSSKTFRIASKLMEYEINTDRIYNNIYVEHLAMVKLKAKMIDKFITLDSGVAYLFNTKEDIAELGASIDDLGRGMINIMSGIEEIKVWANFNEDVTGEVYCELRGNGVNVFKVAEHFGGGGHVQAAGVTLPNKTLVNDVIKCLEKAAKGEPIC